MTDRKETGELVARLKERGLLVVVEDKLVVCSEWVSKAFTAQHDRLKVDLMIVKGHRDKVIKEKGVGRGAVLCCFSIIKRGKDRRVVVQEARTIDEGLENG